MITYRFCRKIFVRSRYRIAIIFFMLIIAIILMSNTRDIDKSLNEESDNEMNAKRLHLQQKYLVLSIEYPEENTYHFSSFSEEVKQFMRLTRDYSISIFSIEPQILISLLKINELNLLESRFLLPKLNNNKSKNIQLISFGIFASDLNKLDKNFMKVAQTSFSVTVIEAVVGNEFSWKRNSSHLESLYYFFAKNNHIIQVVVFHERKNFLWIGSINSFEIIKLGLNINEINYGQYEAAFDPFDLSEQTLNNESIKVPKEFMHFISQLNSSQFIECDHKTAEWLSKSYPTYSKPSIYRNDVTVEGLISMKTLMKELVMPFWIGSGTLLGWYRQCGVIPYISDSDFVTWALYASNEMTDKFANNKMNLTLFYVYGVPDNALQYAFYTKKSDSRVDLFFAYDENNHYTYSAHFPSKKYYFRYIYPYYRLCSAELLGYKVLVPCNPEEVVSAEYGPNWKEPTARWEYHRSAYNMGQLFYWTKQEEKLNIMFRRLA